jgi:hypothetical protein
MFCCNFVKKTSIYCFFITYIHFLFFQFLSIYFSFINIYFTSSPTLPLTTIWTVPVRDQSCQLRRGIKAASSGHTGRAEGHAAAHRAPQASSGQGGAVKILGRAQVGSGGDAGEVGRVGRAVPQARSGVRCGGRDGAGELDAGVVGSAARASSGPTAR